MGREDAMGQTEFLSRACQVILKIHWKGILVSLVLLSAQEEKWNK